MNKWISLTESNTLRPRQNGRHFPDDIFKCIFLNENVWISLKITLKFLPKDPINNIPGLVQIMAWRRPGDKPLSEPMMVSLLTRICVTRPQWVNGVKQNTNWNVDSGVRSILVRYRYSEKKLLSFWQIFRQRLNQKLSKWQIWVQSLTIIWSKWWFPFKCGFEVYWIEVCGNCNESQFDVLLLQLSLVLIYHTIMHIVLTEIVLVLKINSHADNKKSILSQRRVELKRIIHCFESNFSVAEVIGVIRLKIGF